MKIGAKLSGTSLAALLGFAGAFCTPAMGQAPVAPVVVETAVPILVRAVTPKHKPSGLAKFEGFVMNANIAQITARDKNNETSIQTFSLSKEASAKMQQVVDKGGFQYGDKVTVFYDPATHLSSRFKGKPSKPI